MSESGIALEEIPYDWIKPGAYIEARALYETVSVLPWPTKVLLICQKLASGSAEAGKAYQITRPEQGAVLCGAGSIGDQMVRAFKKANSASAVYIVALSDDDDGVAATGKVTITGSVSAAGQFCLYVGGVRVRVSARTTSTPSSIADALAAEITATPSLAVTATANGGVLTLTAKHAGECGNDIDLRLNRLADELTPSGLAVQINAMSGGSGNPDVGGVLEKIAGNWYTDIATPWTDLSNLEAICDEADLRYKAMGKRDAHIYAVLSGTFGQLIAKGEATNCKHLSHVGVQKSPTPPWAHAASLTGICANHLAIDPARQLRTLALPGVLAPAPEDLFEDEEANLLLKSGISTETILTDGTVTLDRVTTTYKTSSLGVADRAWLDIMVPKVLSRIRYDWAGYMSLVYPRSKLARDDSLAAGSQSVATPGQIHGSWGARCISYGEKGWLDKVSETTSKAIFAISADDRNTLETYQPIYIVGNLMILKGVLGFEA